MGSLSEIIENLVDDFVVVFIGVDCGCCVLYLK